MVSLSLALYFYLSLSVFVYVSLYLSLYLSLSLFPSRSATVTLPLAFSISASLCLSLSGSISPSLSHTSVSPHQNRMEKEGYLIPSTVFDFPRTSPHLTSTLPAGKTLSHWYYEEAWHATHSALPPRLGLGWAIVHTPLTNAHRVTLAYLAGCMDAKRRRKHAEGIIEFCLFCNTKPALCPVGFQVMVTHRLPKKRAFLFLNCVLVHWMPTSLCFKWLLLVRHFLHDNFLFHRAFIGFVKSIYSRFTWQIPPTSHFSISSQVSMKSVIVSGNMVRG